MSHYSECSDFYILKNSKYKKIGFIEMDHEEGIHVAKILNDTCAEFQLVSEENPFLDYDFEVQGEDGHMIGMGHLNDDASEIEIEFLDSDKYFYAIRAEDNRSF